MDRYARARGLSPNLLRNLEDIQQMFEQAFGERQATPAGHWMPVADVYETPDAFLISVDLPGTTQDDIRVHVEGNDLILSGERHYGEPEQSKVHKVERTYGTFQRTFQLPLNLDRENIKASLKEGVLTLRLPKKEEVKPRSISIQVED